MGRLNSGALPGRRGSANAEPAYDTISVSSSTSAVRAAPCKVAGFTATAAGTVTIYANTAQTGTLIYPATVVTAGQVVTFAEPYVSFLGVSVTLSGGAQIALSVQ